MKLHCLRLGQGQPLVVLHGLFGSGRNWVSFARSLAGEKQVILLDLRNHGDSPWSDRWDLEAMAGDVAEFVAAEGLEQLTLLGHSLGGKVAMQAAADSPPWLEKLIVVDMAPGYRPPESWDVLHAMHSLGLEGLASRAQADAHLARWVPDAATRQFLLMNLVRHEENWRWKVNLAAIGRNLTAIGADLTHDVHFAGPALFIKGGRSPYISSQDIDDILTVFPGARLVTIPEAGHWVHIDQPEDFRRVVARFLGQ